MASKENIYLGRRGEEFAVELLKENGYRILYRNYKTKLGEIDIIAKDRDCTCFIEVKTRRSDRFGSPAEALTLSKQRQISKAALLFLKENKLLNKKARFDVASVVYLDGRPNLDLIKNAFDLEERYAL